MIIFIAIRQIFICVSMIINRSNIAGAESTHPLCLIVRPYADNLHVILHNRSILHHGPHPP